MEELFDEEFSDESDEDDDNQDLEE